MRIKPSVNYGVWVGFNDLNPFISNHLKLICTGSSQWNKPPRLGEKADIIVFDPIQQEGVKIGSTHAVNYPIGSRIQVLTNTTDDYSLVINDVVNGLPILRVYNSKHIIKNEFSGYHHWCTSRDHKYSFCTDFYRSHALGGYGYIAPNSYHNKNKHYKYQDAIVRLEHSSGTHNIIATKTDVDSLLSTHLGVTNKCFYEHSYFTHILLSPNQDKIAFLYRLWLHDGGILTSLFVTDLLSPNYNTSLYTAGQLSHFCWIDNRDLCIYSSQILQKNSPRIILNGNKFLAKSAKIAKSISKSFQLRSRQTANNLTPAYLLTKDSFQVHSSLPSYLKVDNFSQKPLELVTPTSDGHPSIISKDGKKIFISDTYPIPGTLKRLLYCVNMSLNRVISLSIHEEYKPKSIPNYSWVANQIKLPTYASFPLQQLSFTRSGLHCDLHPFLNDEKTFIGFHVTDSGYRTIKVKPLELVKS